MRTILRSSTDPRCAEGGRIDARFGRATLDRVAGATLVLLGATVITGWWLQSTALVRVLPGFVPMVFNTALCFVLAGVALLVSSARVSSALAAAIAAIATLVLAEHVLRVDLWLDWPSLHAWAADGRPQPGRMAAATACAFLIDAAALLAAPRIARWYAALVLRAAIFCVGAIGGLALAGYVVSARLLFPEYWFAGMALHTAAGLVVLALGLHWMTRRFEWGRRAVFRRADDRIVFTGAMILAAIGLGSGVATFAILEDRVRDLVHEHLLFTHARRADVFKDLIALRETIASIAATRPAVLRNLRVIHAGRDDGSHMANVRAVADGFAGQGFSAIAYYDQGGKLVAAAGSPAKNPALAVTLSTPGRAQLLWDEGFFLRHRLPLHDAAGVVGEVVAEQPLAVLTKLAQTPPGAGETWDMGICVRRAAELFCFPQRLSPEAFSTPLINVAGERLPMTRALAGETGTVITRDYRAQYVLAAFGPVHDLGLGMVVKVDAAEVLRPIREELQIAVGVALVLAAAGALLLRARVRPHASRLVESEERNRAALGQSEAGLHRAQVMARLGHVITGPGGAFESWSATLPGLTGLASARMPQSTREWLELLHPEDRERFRAASIQAAQSGTRVEVEYRLRRADGHWIHVHQFIEPLDEGRWFNTLQDISEERRAERELRASESLKSAILESSLDCIVTMDHEGKIVEFNPSAERTFGFAREQVLGKSMVDLIVPPRLRDAHRRGFAHYLATGEGPVLGRRLELEAVRADGTEFPIELAIAPIKAGTAPMFTGFIRDITQRKESETRIKRLNRVYAVLSGINGLIVRVRDRTELYREACRIAVHAGGFRLAWIGIVDRAAMRVTPVAFDGAAEGYIDQMPMHLDESTEQGRGLVGRVVRERKPMIANDIENDPRIVLCKEAVMRGFRSMVLLPLAFSDRVDGVLALYAESPGFFDDQEMRLLVELAGDISFALEHLEQEDKLDYLAYYDAVTGLANRMLFRERLEQHVQEAARAQRQLAVVLVDIDRFRSINDTFGRQGGDALLKQMAARFLEVVGDPGALARVGADHFAVAIHSIRAEHDLVRMIEAARARILATPFSIDGTELRVATKAGIAVFPSDGTDAESLLRNAEAALMKAKQGGERHLFYAPQMTERVADTLSLENKLRQALEKDQFVLHYQPKVDLEKRAVIGVEALIRWQSPELGLVPPGKFIPLLEETGLILEVGSWALTRAALDHRRWFESGLKPPRVAVNVSPIQLRQANFVGIVEDALIQGIAPVAIDLEITESLIMEDVEATIAKLKSVQALGVKVAIDDFGTGYSSLAYLSKLPVQAVKIDRSFIITMLSDPDTATLVQTMITLAHSLKLTVVAEGVDSEDQANVLRLLRCDEMQGYLFSKPLPADALLKLLKANALDQ